MKPALTLGLTFLLVLTGITSVSAQGEVPDTPLVIDANNNLYAWTPEDAMPRPLTTSGHVLSPSVSPDATEVAYTVFAPITAAAIERFGGIGGGGLPTDIWIVTPATGQLREIAVQPPNASLMVEGVPDYGISRSQPAWSWDGMKLAWSEFIMPDGVLQVVVHDFATNSARVLYNQFPPQYGIPGPMDLKWVGAALVARSIGTTSDFQPTETLFVFDGVFNLINTIDLPEDRQTARFESVLQDGIYYIGVQDINDQWTLYDPLYGTQAPVIGYVEAYAWLAAETGLALEPRYDEQGNHIWQVHDSVGRPIERLSSASYYPLERTTLSPDGETLAFSQFWRETGVYENVVRVLRGNAGANVPDVSADPFVSSIAWGPMAWRTRLRSTVPVANAPLSLAYEPRQPLPTTTNPTGITCPGAPPPRLVPGDTAVVLGTTPNNVRNQPSRTSGQVVGQIPAGAQFSVLEGPSCQDGFTWYRVQYGQLMGWTAEGQNREYWVEPLG